MFPQVYAMLRRNLKLIKVEERRTQSMLIMLCCPHTQALPHNTLASMQVDLKAETCLTNDNIPSQCVLEYARLSLNSLLLIESRSSTMSNSI